MALPFRWNAANVEHLDEHGVLPDEAEYVVEHARNPFPRTIGNGKHVVWGQAADGRYLQVIFIYSPADVIYVIHARPLNERETRQLRKKR